MVSWYEKNGRDLPWRNTKDPYKIWVSEVFLQQTQVSRVIEYYDRMLKKYPTVSDLASSSWEEFFPYFKGLGFYSRGKNMLKCGQEIVSVHGRKFPSNPKVLESLPGIGKYTACAIASFAYKKPVPALDVNLYRVLGRVFDATEKEIDSMAFDGFKNAGGEASHILNHALMDIGSSFCTAKKAECMACPLQNECNFSLTNKKIEIKPKKTIKIINTRSKGAEKIFSVCMLRNNKKYLLEKTGTEAWKFPAFFREDSSKNHRYFLQGEIQNLFDIEISVRPIFWKEMHCNGEYQFSRCQIQSGEKKFLDFTENNGKYGFYSREDIQELYEKNLLFDYSQDFYEKIISMKI